MASVVDRVIEMAEGADEAKRRVLGKADPILQASGLRVVGHDILVAVYERGEQKTTGGIIITNADDRYQGKVGLVLALGPLCSGLEFERWFGGEPPRVGDWIGFNIRDTMEFLGGADGKTSALRVVEWRFVRFMFEAPDKVM